jgi:hypothetical protein
MIERRESLNSLGMAWLSPQNFLCKRMLVSVFYAVMNVARTQL